MTTQGNKLELIFNILKLSVPKPWCVAPVTALLPVIARSRPGPALNAQSCAL